MYSVSQTILLAAAASTVASATRYTNPILPGFHPDPSCIFVDTTSTFFCATSSFYAFPGIPIYASKDLVNWKLASNVFNRPEQIPDFNSIPTGQDGIFAPTLRYHNGTFYLITTSVSISSYKDFSMHNLIFTTTDPYDSSSWSVPVSFNFTGYDPSLFWDDDGTAYFTGAAATMTGTAIALATIDTQTGTLGPMSFPYNGTGIGTAEGPHLYKKDGWYYILVAEGGTQEKHRSAIGRSRSVTGPYENYPNNPFIAAANKTALFQNVGHSDLFHDAAGNWWGVALSMRSGPTFKTMPMGRETVLYPVSWPEGEWPTPVQLVYGEMEGPLPPQNRNISASGAFHDASDAVDFEPGTLLPDHFVHIRFPSEKNYVVSPPGHPNTLQLTPSAWNLSSSPSKNPANLTEGTTFVGRRQVDTLFSFSVDVSFQPEHRGEEAGVSLYLDEARHIDLGIMRDEVASVARPHLRLRYVSSNQNTSISDIVVPLPAKFDEEGLMRLEIKAANVTHFSFSAGVVPAQGDAEMSVYGYAEGSLVTGGYGGTLVGAYATCNGPQSKRPALAYLSRWRYQGQGQQTRKIQKIGRGQNVLAH